MSTLYYVHDPMCSWCWAFRPALLQLQQQLRPKIEFKQLLGGLAPDSDQPMEASLQQQIQGTWQRIQEKLPETRFNFDFWQQAEPRRSTYPACRAVIATRLLNPAAESSMILAIQQAYYLHAQNPSDDAVLIRLAGTIGLDTERFNHLLNNAKTQTLLDTEIKRCRQMGAHSFPTLVLQLGKGYWPVAVDYSNSVSMLETIEMLLD